MQLLARDLGGRVDPAARREYGHADAGDRRRGMRPCWPALPAQMRVWMSHGDHVSRPAAGLRAAGASRASSVAAMGDVGAGIYGVQFHPEVQHTPQGRDLLRNFVLDICGCRPDWTPANFIQEIGRRASAAQVGERPCDLRAERRRGLGGGGDAAPARDRRPADLHLRRSRPAAPGRGGAGGRDLPAAHGHAPDRGRRQPRSSCPTWPA